MQVKCYETFEKLNIKAGLESILTRRCGCGSGCGFGCCCRAELGVIGAESFGSHSVV